MALYALTAANRGQFADPPPAGGFAPAPMDFAASLEAGWEDARRTRNYTARTEAVRQALYARHRAIRAATGVNIARSANWSTAPDFADVNTDQAAGEQAYEAAIAKLRQDQPQAMSGIETRGQLFARLNRTFADVRGRSDQAGSDHPVANFVGEAAGAISDPINLMAGIATAGLGEGLPLLGRVGLQVLSNSAVEAAQVPGRMAEAAKIGPAYSFGQGAFDVATAGVGAGGFELLGAGAKAAFKAAFRDAADPAARGAVHALDDADRAETMFQGLSGETRDAGLAALDAGALRPPATEPAQELGDLFGDAPQGARDRPLQDPGGGSRVTGEAEYYGRPIQQASFDPREIATDAARFQYKAEADAAGVTARLRGVDAWDPTSSGKIIVFEDADGRRFVADGHQRRALALRMEEKGFDARLDGYLFRAADGWTARQVRTIAALKNIREGSGTILDAAKIFRDAPEALGDRSLPVTGDFISQARNLARLEPEAFGAVVNKVIPERYAAEIGAMAAARPDLHPALVKLMREAEPGSIEEARALVSEAMLDDWVSREGEQADFFGGLPPESTTIARAKVKAAVAGALRKDAKIYGQLVKHADAIEAGGNVLLRDANETAAAVNRTALEVLSRLSLRAGDVGEAMAAAAREVIAGKRPGDAARGVVQMVRHRLASGDVLEGVRALRLDPEPPSAAAVKVVAAADDVKTWARVATPAPEDAALEAAPPPVLADLKGDEIAPPGTPAKDLRAAAKAFFDRVLRPLKVKAEGLGGVEVGFNRTGRDKAVSFSGDTDKLHVFAALPQLIERGRLVKTEASRKAGEAGQVKAYHTLEGEVSLGGERRTVQVLVREGQDGAFHYDHWLMKEGPAPGAAPTVPTTKPGDEAGRGGAPAADMGAGGPDVNAAAPEGLFDDLNLPADHERAHALLIQCAPAATQAGGDA